jgi:BirA family transcriptional regulator, biotin operon repressor / biotin---[acetyl-CoA-carboxylase] ligase
MNIIKLDAINSTNDYMKELMAKQYVENFTIVTAVHQTAGRGQMGAEWNVEAGKNLTFSVLIKNLLLQASDIFLLNAAVAVSCAEAIEKSSILNICIKWPNDILAGNKKIGGILVENSIKSQGEIYSVAGIGINVNQENFRGLPKATSLLNESGMQHDINYLLFSVVEHLKRNISLILNCYHDEIWERYHHKLYKKNVPMPFEKDGHRFMGIIKEVNRNGKLRVLLEDDSIAEFGIKEVQLLY